MHRFLLLTFLIFCTKTLAASCYDVTVHVDKTKQNGKAWDFHGGAPDIKACLYDESGYICKAKGKDNKYSEPYCKDSFSCSLGIVRLEGHTVSVEIINIDPAFDSPIDFGSCAVSTPCELGSAKVSFEKKACE